MCRLTDFDYEIPQRLIAQSPLARRDESRLLVLHRDRDEIDHRCFYQIVEYLRKGDVLVLNDTRVLPARLIGRRKTGGRVEALLLNEIDLSKWRVLIKARSCLKMGERIEFVDCDIAMIGTVLDYLSDGKRIMSFTSRAGRYETGDGFWRDIDRLGRMPLPPYIRRERLGDSCEIEDRERYQTVFAGKTGAIAAPTAGLHFTRGLLDEINKLGVETVFVTLHVGIGTFRPIKVNDPMDHLMEAEYYEVSDKAAYSISKAKMDGRRVIAVGTTSCRVLETMGNISNNGQIKPCSGWTSLFIYPPYEFKVVDVLVTNFHQPASTMLLLVSSFGGRENVLAAYKIAIDNGYRFYSYGDSMMVI